MEMHKKLTIFTARCYAIIILHITAAEAFQHKIGNDAFNRARKVVIRDKDRQLRGSYHVESTKDQSIELIVDDLVEKVKNRLKSELKMITSSQGSVAKSHYEEEVNPREEIAAERKKKLQAAKLLQDKLIKPTYIPMSDLEAGNQPTEEPTGQNITPKIGIKKIKRKTTTPDTRYLAEVFTARPPKYLLEYGPPKLLKNPTTSDTIEIKKSKKTYATEDIETVTESTPLTTEDSGAFVGFDLVHNNDSYEDYVTPKKDADYKELEPEPESQTLAYEINKGRHNKIKNRQKMLNDFETANQAMTKTKNRVNLEEYKIEDNVNFEKTMLGDFDRANNPMFEPEDQEYETTEDKLPSKNKALDDFYRAKQLMSKIKRLSNVGTENKNGEKLKHEAVRDFDNLNKAVSYIKDPVFSDIVNQDTITDERAKQLTDSGIQIGNMYMGMKPYPEQLKFLDLTNNNEEKKKTINNKKVNLFESVKIRNIHNNDPNRQIVNRGIEMPNPILRARKNVDALVEEARPVILKRRKNIDSFNVTDSETNETFDDEDFGLIQRILGNLPMKKTKIYLINLGK